VVVMHYGQVQQAAGPPSSSASRQTPAGSSRSPPIASAPAPPCHGWDRRCGWRRGASASSSRTT
jgi:hypothetical protein